MKWIQTGYPGDKNQVDSALKGTAVAVSEDLGLRNAIFSFLTVPFLDNPIELVLKYCYLYLES